MGTEEYDYEEMLQLLRQLVTSMKSGTGPYQGRPTESVTKSSLETMKAIRDQQKDCERACKDRIQAKFDTLHNDIVRIEESHKDLKKRIFVQVEGLGAASKTHNGHVASLESKINRILATVYGCDEGELDDRVEFLEAWVDERIAEKEAAKEASRFKISTVLTIVGIFSAIGLGVTNLVIQIMNMG